MSKNTDHLVYLNRRLAQSRLWNKSAKIPETEAEIMEEFSKISCELSPENLACDGEASVGEVTLKLKELKGAWKELEGLLGRKVNEDEVYD